MLHEHGGPVTFAVVTADGDMVVSASGEDMSVVWCSARDGSGMSRVHLGVVVTTVAVTTACRLRAFGGKVVLVRDPLMDIPTQVG